MTKLFYFYGKTCGPCRVTTKILDDAVASGKLTIPVEKFEASENAGMAHLMDITSVPQVVLVEVDDTTGNCTRERRRWQGLPLVVDDIIAAAEA